MSDFSTQDPERDFRGRRPLFVKSAIHQFLQPELRYQSLHDQSAGF